MPGTRVLGHGASCSLSSACRLHARQRPSPSASAAVMMHPAQPAPVELGELQRLGGTFHTQQQRRPINLSASNALRRRLFPNSLPLRSGLPARRRGWCGVGVPVGGDAPAVFLQAAPLPTSCDTFMTVGGEEPGPPPRARSGCRGPCGYRGFPCCGGDLGPGRRRFCVWPALVLRRS